MRTLPKPVILSPRALLATAASCAFLLAIFASTAAAASIPVTTTADSGAGSLRAALTLAGSGDTVTVPAGTYVLTSGVLTIHGGVTITGAGARQTTISGNHASQVFKTSEAGVTIQNLAVTAGQSATQGSGIASSHGLALHRVAVVGNVSTTSAAGISVDGTAGEPLLIDHSLIAGNRVTGSGSAGGIEDDSAAANSVISDSTIVGNSAGSAAGGIYIEAGTLLLDGDTIYGNSLTEAAGQGGNFRLHGEVVKIRDTILGGGSAGAGANCYLASGVTLTSLGHNAEDTDPHPDSDCQNALHGPGDRAGLSLQLGPLQDNGGPTDTMLPAIGSPVLDAGDASACLSDDQRGVTRPQVGGCDIGAVERSVSTISGTFADGISATGATLHALANTAGLAGSARFAYGLSAAYGALATPSTLAASASPQGATAQLAGLQPQTTYHFRLEVTTPDGTFVGPDTTLTTPSSVTTPTCRVPALKGRSLASAHKALKAAHCKLGKVKKPRHHQGRLVVKHQSVAAKKVLAAGAKVAVTLGPKPARAKRH